MEYARRYQPDDPDLGGEDPLAALRKVYLEAAHEDVAVLEAEIAKVKADTADWPEVCLEMRRVVHNVKGQGTSFGYPLMTGIGASLSQLLKAVESLDQPVLQLIEAHVSALRLVMTRNIEGDGGTQGAELVRRLKGFVDSYCGG